MKCYRVFLTRITAHCFVRRPWIFVLWFTKQLTRHQLHWEKSLLRSQYFAISQKSPYVLCNREVYGLHSSPVLFPILRQMNSSALSSYSLKSSWILFSHVCLVLTSVFFKFLPTQNYECIFLLSDICHMFRPSHPESCSHPNIFWGVEIAKRQLSVVSSLLIK